MEKTFNNNSNKNNGSLLKNIFNREFIISAIIPIIIFSYFSHINEVLTGIILSALWSIGVVIVNYIKERKINALATMAGVFSAVGLIGTIISKDPKFYLIAPIIQDFLYALVFFGSVFLERSLIQIIVEQTYLKNVPEDFRRQKKYKNAWIIITCAWGVLNVVQAVVRIILLKSLSMDSYYAINTLISNISGPVLLAFSITFPRWYWKTAK